MCDDFCLLHGYDYMMREFGNPIAHCWKCEEEREEKQLLRLRWPKVLVSDTLEE